MNFTKPWRQFLVEAKQDKIPGGLADKSSPEEFDPAALAKGIRVEMEHTSDPNIAKEIAIDHLKEDPKYYDKLATIEEALLSEISEDEYEETEQFLKEIEPFQKDIASKHPKKKKFYLTMGANKATGSGKMKKPSLKRSKSAPPGAGGS